jgi:hypothetical protein
MIVKPGVYKLTKTVEREGESIPSGTEFLVTSVHLDGTEFHSGMFGYQPTDFPAKYLGPYGFLRSTDEDFVIADQSTDGKEAEG